MKPTFKAYVAGFLDGDGCISMSKNKRGPYYRLRVELVQKDPADLFDDIIKHFGGSKWYIKKDSKWVYCLTSTPQATRILMKLVPYIRLKHDQAALGIIYGGIMKQAIPVWYGRSNNEGRRATYTEDFTMWQDSCFRALSNFKRPPASETERAGRSKIVEKLRIEGMRAVERMRQSMH